MIMGFISLALFVIILANSVKLEIRMKIVPTVILQISETSKKLIKNNKQEFVNVYQVIII
jgi:hypothetical protein